MLKKSPGTTETWIACCTASSPPPTCPALLHYEDRNSMAFSIESRVPFLDLPVRGIYRVTAAQPEDQEGVTKTALRTAIKGIVPETIRCRMDKMGFVTPEEIWMREDLRPFVLDILSSEGFGTARTGTRRRLSGITWPSWRAGPRIHRRSGVSSVLTVAPEILRPARYPRDRGMISLRYAERIAFFVKMQRIESYKWSLPRDLCDETHITGA